MAIAIKITNVLNDVYDITLNSFWDVRGLRVIPGFARENLISLCVKHIHDSLLSLEYKEKALNTCRVCTSTVYFGNNESEKIEEYK